MALKIDNLKDMFGATRLDLWKANIPADLSFAPAKKAPGKINIVLNNSGHKIIENKVK